MTKLLLFPLLAGMLLASCGDASENISKEASSEELAVSDDKSFCDCMEIASNNPDIDEAPEGCEWIEALNELDAEEALKDAVNDCPDNLPEGMVEMMEAVEAADQLEYMASDPEDDLEDTDSE